MPVLFLGLGETEVVIAIEYAGIEAVPVTYHVSQLRIQVIEPVVGRHTESLHHRRENPRLHKSPGEGE